MTTSTTHYFGERLEWSERLSDEESWVNFYRKLWPDMVSAVRYDMKCWHQKRGVDREVTLKNGQKFLIDEKKRSKDFGDILLEEWSVAQLDPKTKRVYGTKKIGWALDDTKICDYVVYALLPTGKAYLLPFDVLRRTFERNIDKWKTVPHKYPIPGENLGYTTISVGVNWPELLHRMGEEMQRKFGESGALLLDQREVGEQLEMLWAPQP